MSLDILPSQFTIYASLLFLLFLLFSSLKKRSRTNLATKVPPPPEVGGAWPLIGHLHLLVSSQPPHVVLGNLADKYGPIFTLRYGVSRTLVISNYEMAKECFTVNDKAFASRPKTVATEIMANDMAMFGFSPFGDYWRHMRKIATMEVLSNKRIEILKHVMESEVKAVMKESYNNKSASAGNSVTVILEQWFGNLAVNVMFRTMIGKNLIGGMGTCDGDEKENEKVRKTVKEFFHLMGSFTVSDALPFLRWLDLDGKIKKMKKTAKEMEGYTQVWLEQHKRNRKNINTNNGSKGEHDFMDVLLSIVDEEGFHGYDADTIVKATCMLLVLAGTDTTTGTLTWAISLLLNNREVLDKAKHELDTKIGGERMVEELDLEKLEYLQAVIKETLRLYPAGPLGVPRESIEDCVVGGFYVPARTRLLPNISKLQRDPLLYSDPLEFRPERFLTTHKNVDLRGQHFEFIPFGAGRRICPGTSFSLQLMKMTLATLLHGFEIESIDGGPVDMVEKTGLTNVRANPLQVILTPRQSNQIYGQT